MSDQDEGLYSKFFGIKRTDGKHRKGQKHAHCSYFVLDLTHDPFAIPAIRAYARSCYEEYPLLASDLFKKLKALERGDD